MTQNNIFQTCSYEKCDSVVVQAGHCSAHATQLRKGKDLSPRGESWFGTGDTSCRYETCERIAESLGLCFGHYQQQLRGKELSHLAPLDKPECSEEDCTRTSDTRGRCKMHYNRWKLANAPACSFEGCEKSSEAHRLCRGHGAQRRAGKELTPLRSWGKYTSGVACPVTGCTKHSAGANGCTQHQSASRKYNLRLDQISALPTACEVCGSDRKLNIDHDHACCDRDGSCGKCVRGVLCQNCNNALGQARDDLARLRGLISYLERHR